MAALRCPRAYRSDLMGCGWLRGSKLKVCQIGDESSWVLQRCACESSTSDSSNWTLFDAENAPPIAMFDDFASRNCYLQTSKRVFCCSYYFCPDIANCSYWKCWTLKCPWGIFDATPRLSLQQPKEPRLLLPASAKVNCMLLFAFNGATSTLWPYSWSSLDI